MQCLFPVLVAIGGMDEEMASQDSLWLVILNSNSISVLLNTPLQVKLSVLPPKLTFTTGPIPACHNWGRRWGRRLRPAGKAHRAL